MVNTAAPPAQGPQEQPPDRETTAGYIAEMTSDLALLARQQGLDTLAYILEMAKLEAENAMRPAKRRR